jgi:DNA-binding GntR family transcriptional regulator
VKGDKEAAGLLLIGPAKPKKEKDDDGEAEEGGGKVAASKALIKALKDGDAEAVNEALSLHYDLCAMSAEDDEDDYEEG